LLEGEGIIRPDSTIEMLRGVIGDFLNENAIRCPANDGNFERPLLVKGDKVRRFSGNKLILEMPVTAGLDTDPG